MSEWNNLSMKDKASYIRNAVSRGIYDVDKIRLDYHLYAAGGNIYGGGGNTNTSKKLYVYEVLPQLLKEAGLNVRVTSGYRKAGAAGSAGNRSWHTRNGAVDIVPQGDTTWKDIEDAIYNNPTISNYMLLNNLGLLDESGRSAESRATMKKTKATGAHFHIGKDSKPALAYATRMNQALLNNTNTLLNNTATIVSLLPEENNNNNVQLLTPEEILERIRENSSKNVITMLDILEGSTPKVAPTQPVEEEPLTDNYTIAQNIISNLLYNLPTYSSILDVTNTLDIAPMLETSNPDYYLANLHDTYYKFDDGGILSLSNLLKTTPKISGSESITQKEESPILEKIKAYSYIFPTELPEVTVAPNKHSLGGNIYDGTTTPTQKMLIGKAYWKAYWDKLANQPMFLKDIEEYRMKKALEDARKLSALKQLIATKGKQIADRKTSNYLTESNDATTINNGRRVNSHLEERAIEGAKAHAAWEQEHPNLTAWGEVLGAIPLAVAAYPFVAGAAVPAVTALGDAAAATTVGQSITSALTPLATTSIPYIGATLPLLANMGMTSYFGAHGLHDISEGNFTPMTALEIAPMLLLAKPAIEMTNNAARGVADRYLFLEHPNSYTRGIGATDAGLQDAVTTKVFRGNPRGTERTAKDFDKMFLKNRNNFRDIVNDTGIKDIESRYLSRTLTEKDFNALKLAALKYDTSDKASKSGISLLRLPSDPLYKYNTYEDYLADILLTIQNTEQMPLRIASGEITPNTELSEPILFEDESGKMLLPLGRPFTERFGPNSDYVADGQPMSYWYADGRNPITKGHTYAKSNYGVRVNNPEDYQPFMHELHLHPSFFRTPLFADPNVEIFGRGPLGLTVKLDKETLLPLWKRDLSNVFRRKSNTPTMNSDNIASSSSNESKNFISELDWSPESWFGTRVTGAYDAEDIAALQSHLPEYLDIEKIAKVNGTWLKMPDGSTWQGDPRSWVQMQSRAYDKYTGSSPFKYQAFSHTTDARFDTFDISHFGKTDEGFYGKGFYTHPAESTERGLVGRNSYGDENYLLTTNVQNPFDLSNPDFEYAGVFNRTNTNAPEGLFDDYDAVYYGIPGNNMVGAYPAELVVPNPNNYKSLLGNNGNFDYNKYNMYKALIPIGIGAGLYSTTALNTYGGGGN